MSAEEAPTVKQFDPRLEWYGGRTLLRNTAMLVADEDTTATYVEPPRPEYDEFRE